MGYDLQWESPQLDFYWCDVFVKAVYEGRLIEALVGAQESDIAATCSADGFRFFAERSVAAATATEVARHLLEDGATDRLWGELRDLEKQIDAVGWTTHTNDLRLGDRLATAATLEAVFARSVALHLCTQPHLLRPLEIRLLDECSRVAGQQRSPQDIAHVVTRPSVLSEVAREQLAWCELVLAGLVDEALKEALQEHLARWRFTTAGDSHAPMTAADLVARFEHDRADPERIRRALGDLLRVESEEAANEFRHAMNELSLTGQSVAKTLQSLATLRFRTKAAWMKLWYVLEQHREALHRELGQSVEGWTTNELSDALKAQRFFSLREERETYVYEFRDDRATTTFGAFDETRWLDPVMRDVRQMLGQPGAPGCVTGRALRVGWGDEPARFLDQVFADTILVVPQTTPAFIPLLTRCAGVIADEGGIASHVSVITRELGIPSVIGLRTATHVVQSGTRLAIDGARGTVRIILENEER